MKTLSLSLFLLFSTHAFASTVTCTFGEKQLVLEVSNQQVVSAFWSNPDWGVSGAHALDLSQVKYSGSEAIVSGDDISDVNGTYACPVSAD